MVVAQAHEQIDIRVFRVVAPCHRAEQDRQPDIRLCAEPCSKLLNQRPVASEIIDLLLSQG